MSRTYAPPGAPSFAFDRNHVPVSEVVGRVAKRFWPFKTAQQLAARTKATHRAAENWLAGATGLNAEQLADILRSDIGGEVLAEIMRGSGASWWPEARSEIKAHAIEQRLAKLQDEIEEARRGLA